jgi:hypothetical protein
MDATKAQTVISALISQGFQVQAQQESGNWTIIVNSNTPLTSQIVEQFRANQQINATVTQVVLT